jgi:hypothetical protein
LCGIPWNISGYEGALHTFHTANMFHFFCFEHTVHLLQGFFLHSVMEIFIGKWYKTLSNKLIIPSWAEPRTSLDAILDTEVQEIERY